MNETYQDMEPGYNKPLTTADHIKIECDVVKHLLLEKNLAYGDSALSNGLLFNLDPVTALKARINDKLARIANKGINDSTEDTLTDLGGYLILLKIALKRVS